jgi:hypothetical protein
MCSSCSVILHSVSHERLLCSDTFEVMAQVSVQTIYIFRKFPVTAIKFELVQSGHRGATKLLRIKLNSDSCNRITSHLRVITCYLF